MVALKHCPHHMFCLVQQMIVSKIIDFHDLSRDLLLYKREEHVVLILLVHYSYRFVLH